MKATSAPDALIWRLRLRQTIAVSRYELRKAAAGRRWIVPWVLAAAPVFILAARAVIPGRTGPGPGVLELIFAERVFEGYILRLGIFFSTVAVFVQLFRREVQERTLHTYLLLPIRRELIVSGKYLAGLAVVGMFFVPATGISCLLLLGWHPAALASYMALAAFATASYGAVFLLVGTLARNPIIPVLLVLAFESSSGALPSVLQRFSIVDSLTRSEGFWSLASGPGLLTLAALAGAAYWMRRVEVSYATD